MQQLIQQKIDKYESEMIKAEKNSKDFDFTGYPLMIYNAKQSLRKEIISDLKELLQKSNQPVI